MKRWIAHEPGIPKRFGFAVAAIALAAGVSTRTQARAQLRPEPPQFEVASIKPNKSADLGGTWRVAPGGRFTGENIPFKFLLATAYRLKESQISGIPGWTESEKYDIVAKGEGNPTQDQIIAMLQGLLADRFKLRYHQITKEMPLYALVTVRSGIKLRESNDGSCIVPGVGHPPVVPGRRPPDFAELFSREEVGLTAPESPSRS